MNAFLVAKNIRRSYGRTLDLQVAEVSVGAAEVLSILGPSGAGKSTLLRILALLEPPDAGEISIQGKKVSHRSLKSRRRIATVLQSSPLWTGTVISNVEFGLLIRGIRRRERRALAEGALNEVGLAGLEDRAVSQISGGQAQRVGLARALAIEPEILLVDEPLAHIDEPMREGLAYDLRKYTQRTGCTTVWVTHDRAEALAVSDRIAVIEEGIMLQSGGAMDVFSRPKDERVARLVGTDNLIAGTVATNLTGLAEINAAGELIEAPTTLHEGAEVLLLVRPEAVTISKEKGAGASPRNRFSGKIREITYLGAVAKLHIDAAFPLVALVTAPTCEELGLKAGTRIWAGFKATSAHVIQRS